MSEHTGQDEQADEVRYVYDGNILRLHERVEKLNKRAAKLGVPEIQLVLGPAEKVYTPVNWQTASGPAVSEDPDAWGKGKQIRAHERRTVELVGEPPKLAGWSFVAVIDHLSNGTVTQYPGYQGAADLKQFRGSDAGCDHCHTIRKRHETFVVEHEDGTVKRVGRNCIADFLGHQDPSRLLGHIGMWSSIFSDLESCYEAGMGQGEPRLDLETFLAHVAREIRQGGWLSRGKAWELGRADATADRAQNAYWSMGSPHMTRKERERIKLEPEDGERAVKAITWVRALTDAEVEDSDYLWNLRAVCQDDYIRPKRGGLAGSAIVAAERAFEKQVEREREAKKSNEHLGAEKERMTLELTLVAERELESDFGVTYLHRFEDAAGNCLVWFASNASFIPVEGSDWEKRCMGIGETLTLSATVKRHDEYKGRKQTVVTRVGMPKAKKAKKAKK